MKDDFGDRMKMLEKLGRGVEVFDPLLPLCVRIDGKTFSKFTKSFDRPFDPRITNTMVATARRLAEATDANCAYVQSDEISLIYTTTDKQGEHIFGGKSTKINSILASMATAFFNEELQTAMGTRPVKPAFFDCRAWNVPDMVEAANVILWRAMDARRNSISSQFRWSEFGGSAKKMFGLSQQDMIDHMKENGFDWDHDLSDQLKYGTFIHCRVVEEKMSPERLASIPKKNHPVGGMIRRRKYFEQHDFFGDVKLAKRIDMIKRMERKMERVD